MTTRDRGQIAADNALEQAINQYLQAYHRFTKGERLISYVVVAEGVTFGDDGEVESNSQSVITPPGERLSVSKGNLAIGLEIIVDDSEEDE